MLSTDHSLRATTLSAGGGSLAALSASAKPLAAHLPADSAVTVGSDDTVWVAGGGQLRGYPQGGKPQSTAMPLSATDPMQVTTVGDVPVVADTTTKTIYLPDSGHTVTLPSSDTSASFELQQPSAASDVVVAATTQALYSVDLGSGQLTTLSTGHSGSVAAPVQVAGCVHAAWANGATGSYVRTCGSPPPAASTASSASAGSSASTVQQFALDDTTGAPVLVFRVNNGTLVLNDTTDGGVFLIDTNVANVRPKWTPVNTAGNSSNQAQTFQVQEKTQLTAKPYTQGVRPGTTTVVHVLDVDKGPPGTYAVTAVGQPDQPGVTVAVAPDAQTVLATVTSLSTDAHFQYTIDDGHGHTASNEVTLEPRSAERERRARAAPRVPAAEPVGRLRRHPGHPGHRRLAGLRRRPALHRQRLRHEQRRLRRRHQRRRAVLHRAADRRGRDGADPLRGQRRPGHHAHEGDPHRERARRLVHAVRRAGGRAGRRAGRRRRRPSPSSRWPTTCRASTRPTRARSSRSPRRSPP